MKKAIDFSKKYSWQMSDIVISYENSMQLLVTVQVCTGMHSRGCTGFDGGFEVRVAIRGPDPR